VSPTPRTRADALRLELKSHSFYSEQFHNLTKLTQPLPTGLKFLQFSRAQPIGKIMYCRLAYGLRRLTIDAKKKWRRSR
jgi:hypothetical protein